MVWVWSLILFVFMALGGTTFLILTRHHHSTVVIEPSVSVTISINGGGSIDPPAAITLFGVPQLLTSPGDDPTETFGERIWAHEDGFLAIATKLNLYMYLTNAKGSIEYDCVFQASDLLTAEEATFFTANRPAVIVNGCFAPSIGQYPYLFVTVGHELDGYRIGRVVVGLVYDGSKWSTHVVEGVPLRFPNLPDPTEWTTAAGAVGQVVKAVIDHTSVEDQLHVYINATNVTPDQPGGSILWFSMNHDNLYPTATFLLRITDDRLGRIYAVSPQNVTQPSTTLGYLRSFGANFDVWCGGTGDSSGPTDPIMPVLLVSNPGVEDSTYSNNTQNDYYPYPSPNGYVQAYQRVDALWSQGSQNGFARFTAENPGFGTSLVLLDPLTALVTTRDFTNTYMIRSLQKPFKADDLTNMQSGNPGESLWFTQFVSLGSEWAMAVGAPVAGQVAIAVFSWVYDQTKVTATLNLVQKFGTPTAISSNVVGYGQTLATWLSPSGRVVYLAVNDPGNKQVAIYFKTAP